MPRDGFSVPPVKKQQGMEWYWIVLLIFIYLFGWGASAGISKRDVDDSSLGGALGMLWPLVLPVYLGYKILSRPWRRGKRTDVPEWIRNVDE